MKIKSILAIFFTTFFISGCGEVQLGYIDADKVISEAPQLKKVLDEGQQKVQELQEQAMEELNSKQDVSEEDMQQAQVDFQRRMQSVGQAYNTQLRQKLDAAVANVINEKGNIDVVLDSSKTNPQVFMGGVDLTDEVIQKLQ